MMSFRNLLQQDKPQDESRIEPDESEGAKVQDLGALDHLANIEAEPKDPKILGDGFGYVRCRTCGIDVPAERKNIPEDATCPACGIFPFTFDISQ